MRTSKIIYGTFLSQRMIRTLGHAQTIMRLGDLLFTKWGFKHFNHAGDEIVYKGLELASTTSATFDYDQVANAYRSLTEPEKFLTQQLQAILPADLLLIIPPTGLYMLGRAFDRLRDDSCCL